PLMGRDRKGVLATNAVLYELREIERRQDIAVHDEQRFAPPDTAKGPGRAQGLLLLDVLDRSSRPPVSAVENSPDQMGEVADAERHLVEAVPGELIEDDLEDRPVPDRHEGLGQHRGIWSEPRPAAAGEHDGANRTGAVRPPVAAK